MTDTGIYLEAQELRVGTRLKSGGDIPAIVSRINHISVVSEPVYDITVDTYNNFILSAGVCVHNSHISALVTGALAYLCPEIIIAGMVYLVDAPLYKQGKNYIYDESLLNRSKKFDRFKGLGSMNADDVYYTLLDPNTRKLVKLDISDCKERVLDMLLVPAERKKAMLASGNLIDVLKP
jgi:DNA gyrase/topoisomerase IV subunit B